MFYCHQLQSMVWKRKEKAISCSLLLLPFRRSEGWGKGHIRALQDTNTWVQVPYLMFRFSKLTEVGWKKYFNFSSRKKETILVFSSFSYSTNLFCVFFCLYFSVFSVFFIFLLGRKKKKERKANERKKEKISVISSFRNKTILCVCK